MILLLACAALWGWTYGQWDFWGPDEPRYVQIARELQSRSNWLILTIMEEPYDQKPPLPYWMMAGMLKLNGGVVSGWAVRLPSVLFGTLTVLLTYLIGRRRLGRRTGWLAAWMLMTAPLFIEEVPSARLDILLTGFIALALWAWLAGESGEKTMSRTRFAAFWLGLTGAFFIKGPVAWMIVLAPAALEAAWIRSWRPLGRLRLQWGLPFMAILLMGWLASEWVLVSKEFVIAQLKTATIERVVNPTMHERPIHYYLLKFFGEGFLPWSVGVVLALAALWRARRRPGAEWPALRPIFLVAVFNFLIFSLIGTKREQYLLPIYPAMALLAGWFVDRELDRGGIAAWVRRVAVILVVAAGIGFVALAVAVLTGIGPLGVKRPDLAEAMALVRGARFFAARAAALGLFGVLLAASALAWRRVAGRPRAVGLLTGTLFVSGIFVLGAGLPLLNPVKSTREINRVIQGLTREPREKVGALGDTFKAQYMVYGDYRLRDLNSKPEEIQTRGPELQRILIAETTGKSNEKWWRKAEPVLTGLGYTRAWKGPAVREGLSVYVRPEPAGR